VHLVNSQSEETRGASVAHLSALS